MSEHQIKNAGAKVGVKRGKKGSRKKKQKTKKDIIIIALVAISLVGIGGYAIIYFYFGSVFQLKESNRPTGYYRLTLYNANYISLVDLNFQVDIYNQTGLSFSLSVENGVFNDSKTMTSNIYYSNNQSWACIVKDGFKSVFLPIECGEFDDEAINNTLRIVRRAYNFQVSHVIKIATTGIYNYTNFNPGDSITLLSNTNYNLYIQMDFQGLANNSFWCGEQVNLSDSVLPDIARTTGFNTDAHMMIIKGVIENVTLGSFKLPVYTFEYNSQNYSVIILPIMFYQESLVFEITFAIRSNQEFVFFELCIIDGFIDFAFDSYIYYKLGGF